MISKPLPFSVMIRCLLIPVSQSKIRVALGSFIASSRGPSHQHCGIVGEDITSILHVPVQRTERSSASPRATDLENGGDENLGLLLFLLFLLIHNVLLSLIHI